MQQRNAEEDLKVCEAATTGNAIGHNDGSVNKKDACGFDVQIAEFKYENDKRLYMLSREALPCWINRAVEAEELYNLQSDDLISTQNERNEAMQKAAELEKALELARQWIKDAVESR